MTKTRRSMLPQGHAHRSLVKDNHQFLKKGYNATKEYNMRATQVKILLKHRTSTVEQAVTQNDSVDKLQKELENLENNLSIKWGKGERCFRDNRETKLRMASAILRFKSFMVIK